MITERYEGDYTHMMDKGEDTDEFLMRLIHPIGRFPGEKMPKFGTEEADALLRFRWMRWEYQERHITREQREEIVDDDIRRLLTRVGPVEPSNEWVGYF